MGTKSGAPERFSVPASHVTLVALAKNSTASHE
jgi:hypothetical protein